MRCRRLVLPTADLGSLRSQIQQAAASSSDVTAAVSSSPFSPRPWWNSMRIKKLSRSLGTLHLVVSSASSLPYSFSIVMEKPQDPSEEKKDYVARLLEYKFGPEKATIINTYAVMKSGMKNLDQSGNTSAISSQKAQKRLESRPENWQDIDLD
uniref:Uncharacterized protein n=1 Tax=Aegilops tauschii TaxID=37682 RepID=N1QTY0_AEGTA